MKTKVILLLLIITSCKDNTPKTYKIPYTVLTDQIYTRLPGKLLLDKNYLIWQDPFISKDFIKIINTQSGKQVGEAGIIGKDLKNSSLLPSEIVLIIKLLYMT